MKPQLIRELTKLSFEGKEINDGREIVDKFKWFIGAYCADFKSVTEYDILNNDELFESVFGLFKSATKIEFVNL